MNRDWKQYFSEDNKRDLPAQRALRTSIRALHLGAMAILVGGHFFDVPAQELHGALTWTAVTGALFVALEVYCAPGWLFQMAGVSTALKLLMLALVPLFWEQRVWVLGAVIALATVNSHGPSGFRHYSVLTRKVEHERKG